MKGKPNRCTGCDRDSVAAVAGEKAADAPYAVADCRRRGAQIQRAQRPDLRAQTLQNQRRNAKNEPAVPGKASVIPQNAPADGLELSRACRARATAWRPQCLPQRQRPPSLPHRPRSARLNARSTTTAPATAANHSIEPEGGQIERSEMKIGKHVSLSIDVRQAPNALHSPVVQAEISASICTG